MKRGVRNVDDYEEVRIPASIPPITRGAITTLDRALLIGDLHVPHHSAEMLRRAVYITRRYHPGVQTLVIGGDLFDFGSLSSHAHTGPEDDLNDSMRLAGDVLRALGQHFVKMIILPGNHDERLARKLDKNWDFGLLVNAALGRDWPDCEVTISEVDYLYMGERWLVGHPSNYSGRGGQTPADLADLWGRNVVTWHNHIVGYSQSKSGRYVGIDAGHCTVAGEHFYSTRRLSKYTRWTGGFVVLDEGYPHIYNDHMTNWEELGC